MYRIANKIHNIKVYSTIELLGWIGLYLANIDKVNPIFKFKNLCLFAYLPIFIEMFKYEFDRRINN